MNTKNLSAGIYIATIAPLGLLPTNSSSQIIFRVSFQIAIPENQEMHLDIEVPAQSPNQAAQVAYLKAATTLASLADLAKEMGDALLAKIGTT